MSAKATMKAKVGDDIHFWMSVAYFYEQIDSNMIK